MSYEIVGETIKSATSLKLGDIFKTSTVNDGKIVYTYPYRYKENITKQRYPNFHIIQVSHSVTPRGLSTSSALNKKQGRIQLDYLMNIQYRVAEDTETVTNLQQQLNDVGLKLLANFTSLDLELPTKIKGAYYEKADGILQFFFNITVFALPDTEQETIMDSLNSNVDLEKED